MKKNEEILHIETQTIDFLLLFNSDHFNIIASPRLRSSAYYAKKIYLLEENVSNILNKYIIRLNHRGMFCGQ